MNFFKILLVIPSVVFLEISSESLAEIHSGNPPRNFSPDSRRDFFRNSFRILLGDSWHDFSPGFLFEYPSGVPPNILPGIHQDIPQGISPHYFFRKPSESYEEIHLAIFSFMDLL